MPLDVVFTPAPNMERILWNAFKKQARKEDPLASKYDHRYYERLRNAYKAQRDSTPNLDRWVILKPVPPSDGYCSWRIS